MKRLFSLLLICSVGQLHAQTMLAPYETTYAGAWANLAKIADINGDGRNDVIIVNGWYFSPSSDGTFFAFLQDSLGGLGTPVITHFTNNNGGSAGMGIDAYDFDGDGLSDVVIGFNDTVRIFKSLGNGSFQKQFSITSGHGVDGISIGDLDNDGYMDIAVSHWNSNYIRVMWGGATAFQFTQQTYTTVNAGYDQILIAKIGRDSISSLIYMRGQGFAAPVEIYKFNNGRTIVDSIIITNSGGSFLPSAKSIAVGDRQNDGYNELGLVWGGNMPDCGISFYDSLHAAPDQIVPTTDIPQVVAAAQMNCKPGDEYVIVHNGWNTLSVVSQDTTVTFFLPYNTSSAPQGMAIGDINSDGYNDVVIAGESNGLIILYNQSGVNPHFSNNQMTFCSNDSAEICAPAGFTDYVWNNNSNVQCINTNQAGLYSVALTNISGCNVHSDTVSLVVHQAPLASAIAIGDTITASGGGDYSWYMNGVLLSADTSAVYVAMRSAQYYVIITDTNGCSDISVPVQIIIASVPLLTGNENFSCYPNPLREGIRLSVNGIYSSTVLEIFDADGKQVYNTSIDSAETQLDLSNLTAGQYLIKVNNTTKSFVIQ
ncbi:MAG: hypothetical protein JWO03_1620 [Bacteroidetes bacterium]|nr:hypothetical protein [Bacteroidota bacterium]